MIEQHKHTFVCDKCGNEADMLIKEEEIKPQESEVKPKKKVVVCKNCGNEANMTLEEIDI